MNVTETTVQSSNITEVHQGPSCIIVKLASPHHSKFCVSLAVAKSTGRVGHLARERRVEVAHSEG
jgi:hypothetical protein